MEKNRDILVSVIMPVFNAAEYLEQTLLSVLASEEGDIELIAVDDGSKDNSLEILNKYSRVYNNLEVITQENSGPSAARNNGLSHAKGEFVFFLDSDDLLEVFSDSSSPYCERIASRSSCSFHNIVFTGCKITFKSLLRQDKILCKSMS